jgi:hypothetical protein
MLFDFKNVGITFQRMMDQIFANIPYIFIYHCYTHLTGSYLRF